MFVAVLIIIASTFLMPPNIISAIIISFALPFDLLLLLASITLAFMVPPSIFLAEQFIITAITFAKFHRFKHFLRFKDLLLLLLLLLLELINVVQLIISLAKPHALFWILP